MKKYHNSQTLNAIKKEEDQILNINKQILDTQNATQNQIENLTRRQNSFFGRVATGLSVLCLLTISLAGFLLIQDNSESKLSNAAAVYVCSDKETLNAGQCTIANKPTATYTEGCETGYTTMNAVCVKSDTKTCADYPKAMDAEAGLCKVDAQNVLIYEIIDKDGRYCGGLGYNFKMYNVGRPRGATDGAVVCANSFDVVSTKEVFRFIPKNITDIKNIITTQNTTGYTPCPTGYTASADKSQCSRPATSKGCDMAGEYFQNSVCTPCPAGQYCPNNSTATTKLVCANGGDLTDGKCIAKNKISITTYIDGCGAGYTKMDQSCAIIENRTHDTGCTYFYASETVNVTAVPDSTGKYCTTGGRTDFATTSIYKISDLQCDGPNTYYYNYNVSYDPTICGSSYSESTKSSFKWLPTTFSKITAIQKIVSKTAMECPASWMELNADTCYQNPINQEYKTPIDCPINTYCPPSSPQPTNCPAGTTSPAKSTMASDCKPIACTNGAINPPTCNQCAGEKELIGGNCIVKCTTKEIRDSTTGNCKETPTPVAVITPPTLEVITLKKPEPKVETKVEPKKNCVADAGFYSAGEFCVICPKGYYCPAGAINPTICPVGMTTDGNGSKSVDECKAVAKPEVKTTIRTGGLTSLLLVLAPMSVFALAYVFYISKTSKSTLDQKWSKIK